MKFKEWIVKGWNKAFSRICDQLLDFENGDSRTSSERWLSTSHFSPAVLKTFSDDRTGGRSELVFLRVPI